MGFLAARGGIKYSAEKVNISRDSPKLDLISKGTGSLQNDTRGDGISNHGLLFANTALLPHVGEYSLPYGRAVITRSLL